MPVAEKLDLYKLYKSEYIAPKTPKLVETKPALYLSVTGKGEPGSEEFTGAFDALYPVAFTIKMTRKAAGQDYVVSHNGCKGLKAVFLLSGTLKSRCMNGKQTGGCGIQLVGGR